MAMYRAHRTPHLTAAPRRSLSSATTLALAVLLGACSSGDADPAPSFSGSQSSPGSGGSGSVNAPPTSPGSTSNNSTNTNTPSTTNTNQQTASSPNNNETLPTNLSQTNGSAGSSGSGSNNNSNNNNTNSNNTNSGTQGSGGAGGAGNNTASGGSAGSASTMGTAGNGTMPPPAGNAGTSGTGSAGAGGNTQPPPANTTPDIACPTGATFCSGFESTTLPSTAIFQSNPMTQFAFDTTVKHSGNQSLMITSKSGFNIQEVVVPIPGNAFWVRLFIQTSDVFGDDNHDSLFVGSTASMSQDNNAEDGPEFSEQGNQILINADDKLTSMNGGNPQGTGPQLSANTWHCVEAHYDGGSGDVEFFSDGTQLINAPGLLKTTYQTFRFGYIGFNTARTVWYDDVIVSSARVGCN